MARRNKKNELDLYIHTPEKQLTHPSGFCITGHHSHCRYQFSFGKCGCDCHTEVKKKRGRPRKSDV
jgi:hypothetical protein